MEEKTEIIRGYKLFNSDWTCKGFQFEVGRVFTEDVKPELYKVGFHFCTKADDCFTYGNYYFDPQKTKAAEVVSLGEVASNEKLYCTNKILILREIPWEELLNIVNSGRNNTGRCNSGNWNSGNYNSGNYNSGNCNSGNHNSEDRNSGNHNSGYSNSGFYNSGYYNSGNCNSGFFNSGNRNSGNCNSGFYNSGDFNSGDFNSGDWNSGDFNKANKCNGCFNTKEQKIYLFNKPSEWTFSDWRTSPAYKLMCAAPVNDIKYIRFADMTDEEKEKHPEAQTTGGYLKKIDKEKNMSNWWRGLSEEEKSTVKSIPNFDRDIFKEITGVDVDED